MISIPETRDLASQNMIIRHRAAARRRVWAALSYVPWAQYNVSTVKTVNIVKTVKWES